MLIMWLLLVSVIVESHLEDQGTRFNASCTVKCRMQQATIILMIVANFTSSSCCRCLKQHSSLPNAFSVITCSQLVPLMLALTFLLYEKYRTSLFGMSVKLWKSDAMSPNNGCWTRCWRRSHTSAQQRWRYLHPWTSCKIIINIVIKYDLKWVWLVWEKEEDGGHGITVVMPTA